MAIGLAGCSVVTDFEDGVPCRSNNDCFEYACVGGVCKEAKSGEPACRESKPPSQGTGKECTVRCGQTSDCAPFANSVSNATLFHNPFTCSAGSDGQTYCASVGIDESIGAVYELPGSACSSDSECEEWLKTFCANSSAGPCPW